MSDLNKEWADKVMKEYDDEVKHVSDSVNHPRHYNSNPSGVECITIVEHMTFNIGNAMKYLWRSDHANGILDLRKAQWYIQREIERLTKQTELPPERI